LGARAGGIVDGHGIAAALTLGAIAILPYRLARLSGNLAMSEEAASPAPMRQAAVAKNDVQRMGEWAGQSAAVARPEPAADFVRRIWAEAQAL
jgi:NAD(P)H-dependent flavin oxidoreductase YrpB (nitropropane dioxygenase family)